MPDTDQKPSPVEPSVRLLAARYLRDVAARLEHTPGQALTSSLWLDVIIAAGSALTPAHAPDEINQALILAIPTVIETSRTLILADTDGAAPLPGTCGQTAARLHDSARDLETPEDGEADRVAELHHQARADYLRGQAERAAVERSVDAQFPTVAAFLADERERGEGQ